MAKKAVAKKEEGGVPAYLQKLQGQKIRNEDNFDSSDVIVPRIKLIQATSGEAEAFDDARKGRFWHTGFDCLVNPDDPEQFDFVICSRNKKYLLVAPMEDGQGILARADDFQTWDRIGEWQVKIKGVRQPVTWSIEDKDVKASGLDQWGTYNPDDENSPPAATLFYDYLILIPDHLDWGPAVLSLTRSQIKKARKGLNDKIKLHESAGRPMQSLLFRAKSFDDKNTDGQDFKNIQFIGNGFASEQLFDMATDMKNVLTEYKIAGEVDDVEEGTRPQPASAESDEY